MLFLWVWLDLIHLNWVWWSVMTWGNRDASAYLNYIYSWHLNIYSWQAKLKSGDRLFLHVTKSGLFGQQAESQNGETSFKVPSIGDRHTLLFWSCLKQMLFSCRRRAWRWALQTKWSNHQVRSGWMRCRSRCVTRRSRSRCMTRRSRSKNSRRSRSIVLADNFHQVQRPSELPAPRKFSVCSLYSHWPLWWGIPQGTGAFTPPAPTSYFLLFTPPAPAPAPAPAPTIQDIKFLSFHSYLRKMSGGASKVLRKK